MIASSEVDQTEQPGFQDPDTFQHLWYIGNGPALQSSSTGIKPDEIQSESPFIWDGFWARGALGPTRWLLIPR